MARTRPRRSPPPTAVLLSAALLFCAACIPRTTPSAADVSERILGPGCVFREIHDAEKSLALYVLRIDLHEKTIVLKTVLGQDNVLGRETLPSMAVRLERPGYRVAAGVNAAFWTSAGLSGLAVKEGVLVRSPNTWSSIVFDSRNEPDIDVFEARVSMTTSDGSEISIDAVNSTRHRANIVLYTGDYGERAGEMADGMAYVLDPRGRTLPACGTVSAVVEKEAPLSRKNAIPADRWLLSAGTKALERIRGIKPGHKLAIAVRLTAGRPDVRLAASGGPRLVRRGRVSVERMREGQREGFDREQHPRTAIGYTENRRFLVMAVVDGRRPGHSRGVDLYELAGLMRSFGCFEAMNLDGGGSSTMVLGSEVVNRPSDQSGTRAVASGLFVLWAEEQLTPRPKIVM